jgi:DNA-binding CsgD family transcriptional regulator
VRLIVGGGTVASVAEELFISGNTVKTHLKSAYRKLGVDNRKDAARRAGELGLHINITRG